MIARLKDILRTQGGEWVVSFTTRENPVQTFYRLKDHDVSVDIKKATKKRSKTANDFMWAMCTDIARAINPPITKEEVYRKAMSEIKNKVNNFEAMHMREEAIPTFREIWSQRGTAWFTEILDYSPIPGCKVVLAYKGSSTFSTSDMSVLIENLKQEMINMELPIPISKEEEERLMAAWGKASCKKTDGATSAEE